MTIRRMRHEDVQQVALIEYNCFSQPWSRQAFLDSLALPEAVFLVAEEEIVNSCGDFGRMVYGYVGMYLSIDEGEITNVAVHELFRGKGVAKALIEELQQEAIRRGVHKIVLEVRVSNAPAIRVYEQKGFRCVGVRKAFYEKPKEDANIMVWEK